MRLRVELARREARSLRSFAHQAGRTTYAEIASELDGPFAPIQMLMALRSEFEHEGDFPGFVADTVARYLREYVPPPTATQEQREFTVASGFAACVSAIGAENLESVDKLFDRLRPQLDAGWVPSGADDVTVREAVSELSWRAAKRRQP
jgi:hypothetical protein